MNLKGIVLSERSQTHKIACCAIPFMENSRRGEVICSDRKQTRGCLGWREAEVEAGGRNCKVVQGDFLGVIDMFVM